MKAAGSVPAGPPIPPGGLAWPPLVPLVLAVSLGIIIDRHADPWETSTWAVLALGAGVVGLVGKDRELVGPLGILAAFLALGGGWHHARWSDRGPDDLGE